MSLCIKEVCSRKELKQFVRFPFTLYADNPYWVPPLISDQLATLSRTRNPAFDYCEARYWLAYRDDIPVGRIAGILNTAANEKWQRKYVRFGWFDVVDDEQVSAALLKVVETWSLEKNMEAVHGPLGFTDMDAEGLLVDGFDRLGTLNTLYNYPYYPAHLEKLGYTKDADWLEFEIAVPRSVPERIHQHAQEAAATYNVHLRPLKTADDLLPYARGVFDLINQSYAHLYGVVPLSTKQIESYTRQYFPYMLRWSCSMIRLSLLPSRCPRWRKPCRRPTDAYFPSVFSISGMPSIPINLPNSF